MDSKEIVLRRGPEDLEAVTFNIKGISENTRNTYVNAVKSYFNFLAANKQPIGFESMQAWLDSIENPKTQNTYLQALKKSLRELYKDDPRLMDLEKTFKMLKHIKIDRTIKEADYLTQKEVKELVKKVNKRHGLIIEALFWTGCRVSELINIKIKHCKKSVGYYTIDIIAGKGSKQRDVFIPDKLFDKIIKEFQGDSFLFEHRGKKYHRSFISDMIKRHGKEYLERHISAHTLRHSCAMYLKLVRKLTPDQVQKYLGHTDVKTTLTYYYHGVPTPKDLGII